MQNRTEHYAYSLRVKPNIGLLLEDLTVKTGMSKAAVITLALRELGKKEGVPERVQEDADNASK